MGSLGEFSTWREAISLIGNFLSSASEIGAVERAEYALKQHLLALMKSPVSGDDARFLATWSRDLGFILKSKPYGVKCTTPLGYSIFLLKPGEGFSFQRHLSRKTEVFHILEPLDGARAFVCDYERLARQLRATDV